jgi:hypothetical protein
VSCQECQRYSSRILVRPGPLSRPKIDRRSFTSLLTFTLLYVPTYSFTSTSTFFHMKTEAYLPYLPYLS